MRVTTTLVHVPWLLPMRAAHGGTESPRPLILLSLEADDGTQGFGEAAPLVDYDGVSVDDVQAALEACRPLLEADEGWDHAALMATCQKATRLPQALAAIDMALWDLAGHLGHKPVWELLGATSAPSLLVNATVGAERPAAAADQAWLASRSGFNCVKVKVGIGDDVARVSAVRRAVGPDVAIRIDANGAWGDRITAAHRLAELAPYGIELCEQPIPGTDDVAALEGSTSVPLALDEAGSDPDALQRRCATAICLKISRCGGITGLLAEAAAARQIGYEVYVASTMDGPLGIAAALHAVAAVLPDRPCGLATLGFFNADAPIEAADGRMVPPPGLGLGDGLVDWYAELSD